MHSIYVHSHCIGGFHPRQFNESGKLKVYPISCAAGIQPAMPSPILESQSTAEMGFGNEEKSEIQPGICSHRPNHRGHSPKGLQAWHSAVVEL